MKRCRYCGDAIVAPKRRSYCSADHARLSRNWNARENAARRRALLRGATR